METPEVLDALAALAQETRLGIFRLLVQAGPDGRPAGAIAGTLAVPPATLSFHLAQLTRAGLIVQRRESRSLIYTAAFDRMHGLLAYLTENCCGRPAVASPAAGADPSGPQPLTGGGEPWRPRRPTASCSCAPTTAPAA